MQQLDDVLEDDIVDADEEIEPITDEATALNVGIYYQHYMYADFVWI